jgi:hypothetical protein
VGENGEPALVLSTDAMRAELFGDAAVQGPWDEIRAVLLKRLEDAVAAGQPVILDATHARRPWRLLYTQLLALPRPDRSGSAGGSLPRWTPARSGPRGGSVRCRPR